MKTLRKTFVLDIDAAFLNKIATAQSISRDMPKAYTSCSKAIREAAVKLSKTAAEEQSRFTKLRRQFCEYANKYNRFTLYVNNAETFGRNIYDMREVTYTTYGIIPIAGKAAVVSIGQLTEEVPVNIFTGEVLLSEKMKANSYESVLARAKEINDNYDTVDVCARCNNVIGVKINELAIPRVHVCNKCRCKFG